MTGDSFSNPPKLKTGEYETWSVRFEAYVTGLDGEVWQIIEQGLQVVYDEGTLHPKERTLYTTEDFKKLEKNARALRVLHSALEPGDLKKVIQFKDPSDIWDSLKKIYEGSKDVKRNRILSVQTEFLSLKQVKNETLHDYHSRFQGCLATLSNLGRKYKTWEVTHRFLQGLSPEWDDISRTLAALPDTKDNSLEELVSRLESNMLLENSKLESREPQKVVRQVALYGESSKYKKFRGKEYYKNKGRETSKSDNEELNVMTKALKVTDDRNSGRKPGKINDQKKNVECFYCKKKGHFKKDCYKLKNDEARRERNQKDDYKGKKSLFAWGDSDEDNDMRDLRRNVCLMAKGSSSSSVSSPSSRKSSSRESSSDVSSNDSFSGHYTRSDCISMIKKLVLKNEDLNALITEQDERITSMFEENHQKSIRIRQLEKVAGKKPIDSGDQFYDSPKEKVNQKSKTRPGLGYGKVSIAKPMQGPGQPRNSPRQKVDLDDDAKTFGKGYHMWAKDARRCSLVRIDFEKQKQKVSEDKKVNFRKQLICFNCGMEGHSRNHCKKGHESSKEVSKKSGSSSGTRSTLKQGERPREVVDPSSSRGVSNLSSSNSNVVSIVPFKPKKARLVWVKKN